MRFYIGKRTSESLKLRVRGFISRSFTQSNSATHARHEGTIGDFWWCCAWEEMTLGPDSTCLIRTDDSVLLKSGSPMRGGCLLDDPRSVIEGDTDGSFLAISITRERVMLYTDYFEQYPVYIRGSFELSNVPGVLVRPGDQLRLDSVREFLMMGTTLASEPCLSANVQRLRPAGDSPLVCDRWATMRSSSLVDFRLPPSRADLGGSVEAASEALVEGIRCLSDASSSDLWLQLTGGRDSRLLLGACLAAGLRPRGLTLAISAEPGYPETRDVAIARMLCARFGLEHHVIPVAPVWADVQGEDFSSIRRLLVDCGPGTVSLEDCTGFSCCVPRGLRMIEGVGGEIVRGGFDHLVGPLARHAPHRRADVDARTIADVVSDRLSSGKDLLTADSFPTVQKGIERLAQELVDGGVSSQDLSEALMVHYVKRWHAAKSDLNRGPDEVFSPLLWSKFVMSGMRVEPNARLEACLIRTCTERWLSGSQDIPFASRSVLYGTVSERRPSVVWGRMRSETERARPGTVGKSFDIAHAAREVWPVAADCVELLLSDKTRSLIDGASRKGDEQQLLVTPSSAVLSRLLVVLDWVNKYF